MRLIWTKIYTKQWAYYRKPVAPLVRYMSVCKTREMSSYYCLQIMWLEIPRWMLTQNGLNKDHLNGEIYALKLTSQGVLRTMRWDSVDLVNFAITSENLSTRSNLHPWMKLLRRDCYMEFNMRLVTFVNNFIFCVPRHDQKWSRIPRDLFWSAGTMKVPNVVKYSYKYFFPFLVCGKITNLHKCCSEQNHGLSNKSLTKSEHVIKYTEYFSCSSMHLNYLLNI